MTVWNNSMMEAFFPGAREFVETKCQVKIEGRSISVFYHENDGRDVVYDGQELAPGHYKLTCATERGEGSLHRYPYDDDVLEGSWTEFNEKGMWRIKLQE